jgi:hypothetical protein
LFILIREKYNANTIRKGFFGREINPSGSIARIVLEKGLSPGERLNGIFDLRNMAEPDIE